MLLPWESVLNCKQNNAVVAEVPFFEAKAKYLQLLKTKEDVISWTALITGPFFDWVSEDDSNMKRD